MTVTDFAADATATTPPTAAQPHRPLGHAALLELRDLLHTPEFSVAAGTEELDAWLVQLDDEIDAGRIDPRPSWELAELEAAERVAGMVAEKLGPVIAGSAEELAAAVATKLGAAISNPSEALLDRQQLAEALGVSRASVDRLRRRPGFPEHRVGDAPRFIVAEVRYWLDATDGGKRVGLRLLPGAK